MLFVNSNQSGRAASSASAETFPTTHSDRVGAMGSSAPALIDECQRAEDHDKEQPLSRRRRSTVDLAREASSTSSILTRSLAQPTSAHLSRSRGCDPDEVLSTLEEDP